MAGIYDDWELSVRTWQNGDTDIIVDLPHNIARRIELRVDKLDAPALANILDAGLTALQTNEEPHGRTRPTDNR